MPATFHAMIVICFGFVFLGMFVIYLYLKTLSESVGVTMSKEVEDHWNESSEKFHSLNQPLMVFLNGSLLVENYDYQLVGNVIHLRKPIPVRSYVSLVRGIRRVDLDERVDPTAFVGWVKRDKLYGSTFGNGLSAMG